MNLISKLWLCVGLAIDTALDAETARIDRFIRELLRCMEQHTEGVTATMEITPGADVDADAAEARMQDREVTDWYIELNEATASATLIFSGGSGQSSR